MVRRANPDRGCLTAAFVMPNMVALYTHELPSPYPGCQRGPTATNMITMFYTH